MKKPVACLAKVSWALICLVLLAGCNPDLRINGIVSQAIDGRQPYDPAIIVVSLAHREDSILGYKKKQWLELKFVALQPVQQVFRGQLVERRLLSVGQSGGVKVLALPPGEYGLAELVVGSRAQKRQHQISTGDREVVRLSLQPGEVVNLGYVESWYSRKDKAWLDLRTEPREDDAINALRQGIDNPEKYVSRMETRLLALPKKVW